MNAYYLGIDCSTQSLTAMLLEVEDAREHDASSAVMHNGGGARSATVAFEHTLVFDEELPHYGTRHGVLPREDPLAALSPPLMWAEALERIFAALADSGLDLSRIRAISGSAQQHGSVYLGDGAAAIMARLDPARPLAEQLVAAPGFFSRSVSPIWMDASTGVECDEITEALGGARRLARVTGSRAFERFTGPQIRKFWKAEPEGWAATARIHLVSSFLASLLTGGHAPLEPGDASGMNLMDLHTRDWSMAALDATAPDLVDKLPAVVPSSTVVGVPAPYWRERFGLPPARVVAFSGDNPSSLIGTGLVREGTVAISLGTSDTVFGLMHSARVDSDGTGHVFGAPTGDYMGLTCFRNGSLARERVRGEHGLDWAGFGAALRATPPGNDGALMFPWFEPEITPHVSVPGLRRIDLDAADGPRNVRALVEAQMMAMANHSRWMRVEIDVIHATGGAAVNEDILRVMADVFGAEVRRFEVSNSACLGAALRARHADALADGRALAWEELVRGIAEPGAPAIRPDARAAAVYDRLRHRYEELEEIALSGGND
jgi:xylulokinase